ncbi:hypothetical protein G6F22_021851 [Rhizopus arrhizus]|nr:hypothetical protein G6F22_021851 [Rhizopus arrhizus]
MAGPDPVDRLWLDHGRCGRGHRAAEPGDLARPHRRFAGRPRPAHYRAAECRWPVVHAGTVRRHRAAGGRRRFAGRAG